MPLSTDPAPDSLMDERLRKLARVRLDTERDVARARHLLALLAAGEPTDGRGRLR